MSLFQLLIQFVFRITFGVALAMSITPASRVSSGFYRVHLWVLMGFNTLAALTLATQRESLKYAAVSPSTVLLLAAGLALFSYIGSVCWLYEKVGGGFAVIWLITLGALAAALSVTSWLDAPWPTNFAISALNVTTSGLLLGVALAAMFLGHWYLNTPTMELLPLKRLVGVLIGAALVRCLVSGVGLYWQVTSTGNLDAAFWTFVALRWLSGLIGTLLLAVMTWQTLKIPNTQSATGILYAAVTLVFVGELTSQFLSANANYPL